jgi:hypothetical protein
MRATVISTRKTKKSADRECDWYRNAEPMNQRVINRDGIYYVVRDWHPSDTGRSFDVIEVTS